MMLVLKDPQPGSTELSYVRKALEGGQLVIVPTDTVYGIAARADDAEAVARLYAAKGRPVDQPTAVIYGSTKELHDALPELGRRATWAVSALLPGPWTLIVDNPAGHLPWLTGGAPGPLGVRVPGGALDLPPIAASSANRAGEPTISRVQEIDGELGAHVACAIDRGELGTRGASASTVLDLTAWERGEGDVVVVRDDAGRAPQAMVVLRDAPEA